MRDEQFWFRPRHSKSLQLDRLVERITKNFGEKRIGAVILDIAKAFDTVSIDGTLYKLTILNFPSYSPINFILTSGSDVRSVLPDGHFISRHEGWGGSG